jgi:26S proteasome regulatory subunit N9
LEKVRYSLGLREHLYCVSIALCHLSACPIAVSTHPILASLSGSPHAWLADLMRAYQSGSIDGFNQVVSEHRAAFEAQPALAANVSVLKEKIALLAIMELAATKPGVDRSIPVADLSRVTRLPGDQVEWLVMRALSLGLVKGSIDEVSQVVHFTYIRPRVLDDAQVSAIRERIEDWRDKAHKMLLKIEDSTTELLK